MRQDITSELPSSGPETDGDPGTGWHDDLAAAMGPLEAMGAAALVIDAADGTILGATRHALDLLDQPSLISVHDLVARGIVAKPDLVRLLDWIQDRRRVDRRSGSAASVETAHSTTGRLRVHRPGRESIDVDVSLVYHRRPQHDAEAATVSLRPVDRGHAIDLDSIPQELWTLHDVQMRVIATDPRLEEIGISPASQVGMPATTLIHPEDLPGVLDPVNAVVRGRARSAQIRVRAAITDGAWQQGTIELRRLVTGDGPLILSVMRFERPGRRSIPRDVLTARQRAIVAALFDGRRVKEIAATDHVSVRPVRNQLAAVYRKLDVSGQGDLLATYLRPHE